MYTVLIVLLLLVLLGAIPRTGSYSQNWGYWPSTGAGLVLVIVLILLLAGRL